jgi:DNA-binding beta-propeller fold protein YncE
MDCMLFCSNSNANKVEVIDMKSFTIVSTIGTGNIPDAMAFME